jgi:predicted nucleic acid-binding protein
VPAEVAAEILAGPPHDPARRALESGWGERLPAVEVPAIVLEWGLGRGESAVLTVALRDGTTALVDDGEARRCARALGVQVMGTLGLVVRAKRAGQIESAGEVLRAMTRAGFRLRNDVIAQALRELAGEEWCETK